jgi:hypothetical protein
MGSRSREHSKNKFMKIRSLIKAWTRDDEPSLNGAVKARTRGVCLSARGAQQPTCQQSSSQRGKQRESEKHEGGKTHWLQRNHVLTLAAVGAVCQAASASSQQSIVNFVTNGCSLFWA